MKRCRIVRELRQDGLLLQKLIKAAALSANDKTKYYLSLLQIAVEHVEI
jgi:hypothetical protein